MTATTDRITELLTKAGAKEIIIGRQLDLTYADFQMNGQPEFKFGTTPADLLTRVEHWLRQSSKQ